MVLYSGCGVFYSGVLFFVCFFGRNVIPYIGKVKAVCNGWATFRAGLHRLSRAKS